MFKNFLNKKHDAFLYNILLSLSRNIFFYENLKLKDSFETRVYLIFLHYSILLSILKIKQKKISQTYYDSLFLNIENDLRELGFGDVSVNKKMKDLNQIFYDILIKFKKNNLKENLEINQKLILKYFDSLKQNNCQNYTKFEEYLLKFYKFCFELSPENMIKDLKKFKYLHGSS